MVSRQNSNSRDLCQAIKATFRMMPGRRLRMLFPKKNLSPAAIQFYFADQQFVMPFDFELPDELLRHLGIEYYRIQPGIYKVLEDKEHIIVDV